MPVSYTHLRVIRVDRKHLVNGRKTCQHVRITDRRLLTRAARQPQIRLCHDLPSVGIRLRTFRRLLRLSERLLKLRLP